MAPQDPEKQWKQQATDARQHALGHVDSRVVRKPRNVALFCLATVALLLMLSAWTHGVSLKLHPAEHEGLSEPSGIRSSIIRGAGLIPDGLDEASLKRSPKAAPAPLKVLSDKRDIATSSSAAATASPTVLECFQVAQPILTPNGATYESSTSPQFVSTGPIGASAKDSCTVLLMDHVFANSYGAPFVGNYTPPSCQFNRVVMNFTVVAQGRQYDRLALMYLGDTEVWRTSTAEPTVPPGIRWEYWKDMTQYLLLWKTPQTVIFDLGNIVNDKYTASLNATLTATFFTSDVVTDAAPPSDLIIPISKRQGASGGVSQFTVPDDNATNTISFPRNANRAVFSVSANGQSLEEFWWSNVLQSDVFAFNSTAGSFPGFSPFREVQILIDGQLAGVQWPFPVIFTGGVVPGLHRPIVGIDAFDLREHEIDITPWLPYLSDGAQHTFTIQVAGLDDDGATSAVLTQTVGEDWYVTGKIFVWLDDDADAITTGTPPRILGLPPVISVSQVVGKDANGTNETLAYNTAVQRSFSVKSCIRTQRGTKTTTWTQALSYTNKEYIYAYGWYQISDFSLSGTDRASLGSSSPAYQSDYRFPVFCNTTYDVSPQGNITLKAHLVQGLQLQVQGPSVYPTGLEAFGGNRHDGSSKYPAGALLTTSRDGTAAFFETGDQKNSSGYGSTSQVFRFGGMYHVAGPGEGPDVELFFRNVSAVNATLVYDDEVVAGVGVGGHTQPQPQPRPGLFTYPQVPVGGGTGPRGFMYRGPLNVGEQRGSR